jgi:sugar-specific transcriptional regulator TrmB
VGLARTKDAKEWSEVESALRGLGLSESEVDVYKASLSLGPRPASIIAEKAGLKRSHTYNIISALQKRGIVQEIIKNGVRHFSCSPPSSLISLMDAQLCDLSQKKERLEAVIPKLLTMLGGISKQPRVKFYQGEQGIRDIFEDILRTPNDGMYSIVDLQYSWSSHDEDMRKWVKSFIARREEQDIWWNAIAVQSDTSNKELRRRSAGKRKVKMIQGIEIPAEVNIYGNKVALTSTSGEMIGVVIDNGPIVETMRNIHQFLWAMLPDYPIPRIGSSDN